MASAEPSGSFSFDPIAVREAASSVHSVAGDAFDLRVRCAQHQEHAGNLLDALRRMEFLALDPATWGDVWSELGFDALRAGIEAIRGELDALRCRTADARNLLMDTHTGILGQRLDDEIAPLIGQLVGSHNQAQSAVDVVTFENIVAFFLGEIDPALMLAGVAGSTLQAENEADTLFTVLDWLCQAEIGLIHLKDNAIRDLWRFMSGSPAPHTALPATKDMRPSPTPNAKPSPAQPQNLQVASAANSLAAKLQKGCGGAYNSFIAGDGTTNAYPGDTKLAEGVFASSGNRHPAVIILPPCSNNPSIWSWTNIQCVTFVALAFAEVYPNVQIKGNAGDDIWDKYSAPNESSSWSEHNVGDPRKGDIFVIQYTDSQGHDLSYNSDSVTGHYYTLPAGNHTDSFGHVAIVTDVTHDAKGNPTSITILQANTPAERGAPPTDPTQQTIPIVNGEAKLQGWSNNGQAIVPRVLGYLRYKP